jgi:hypothetical protein
MTDKKGRETKSDKNQIKKRRKSNKTLSQKSKTRQKKNFDKKAIREEKPKITMSSRPSHKITVSSR